MLLRFSSPSSICKNIPFAFVDKLYNISKSRGNSTVTSTWSKEHTAGSNNSNASFS